MIATLIISTIRGKEKEVVDIMKAKKLWNLRICET